MIRLAIPKGRLSESVADLLQRSGYDCGELRNGSRRLAFTRGDIEATLVKPSDVAVYVEHGAADIGIRSSGSATSSWTSSRPGRRFGRTGSRCWRRSRP